MPIIPTFRSKTLPSTEVPVAHEDRSAEQQLSKQARNIGKQLFDIGVKFIEAQAEHERTTALMTAEQVLDEGILNLEQEDYRKIPDKYEQLKTKAIEEATKNITLKKAQDEFNLDFQKLILKKDINVKKLARKKQIDQARIDLENAINTLKQSYITSSDTQPFKQALELLDSNYQAGYLSAKEYIQRKKKLKDEFIEAKIDFDIQNNPVEALQRLEEDFYGIKKQDPDLWAKKMNFAQSEIEQYYKNNNRELTGSYLNGELDQIKVSEYLADGKINPQQALNWKERLQYQFMPVKAEPSFYFNVIDTALSKDENEFKQIAISAVDNGLLPFADLAKLDKLNRLQPDIKELVKSRVNAVIAEDMPDEDKVDIIRRLIDRVSANPDDNSLKRLNPEHEIEAQWKVIEQRINQPIPEGGRDIIGDLGLLISKKQQGQQLEDREFGDTLIIGAIDNINTHLVRMSRLANAPDTDEATKKKAVKAINNLLETQEYLTAALRDKGNNFFSAFISGLGEEITNKEAMSFIGGIIGAKHNMELLGVIRKLQDGKTIDPFEKSLLAKYIARSIYDLDISAKKSTRLGHNVGKLVVTAAYFMPEFITFTALFGGSTSSMVMRGLNATQKQAFKRLLPVVANRAIASAVGYSVAGMMNVPRVAQSATQYLIPDWVLIPDGDNYIEVLGGEDGVAKALAKALGVQAAEYVTETLGGVVEKPLQVIGRGVFRKFYLKNRLWTLSDGAIKRFIRQAQFHTPIGETFEEYANEVIQRKIEGRPQLSLTSPEGVEFLTTNILGFSVLQGAFTAASRIENGLRMKISVNKEGQVETEQTDEPPPPPPQEIPAQQPPKEPTGGTGIQTTPPVNQPTGEATPSTEQGGIKQSGAEDIRPTVVLPRISHRLKQQQSAKEDTVAVDEFGDIKFKYTVIDASDLIMPYTETGDINPEYADLARDLQPGGEISQINIAQINKVANRLNPQLLGRSNELNEGAPIIGKDGIIESGNFRLGAIVTAYKKGKGDKYKKFLYKVASQIGLSTDPIDFMEMPILVRVRQTPLDTEQRRLFIAKANAPRSARMSPTEQAEQDMKLISNEMLDDLQNIEDLSSPANDEFFKTFIKSLSIEENAGLVKKDGRPSKQLIDRVRNALFAKAYGDKHIIDLFAEETDPVIGNVLKGMFLAIPPLLRARTISENLNGFAIDKIIVNAARLMVNAKRTGTHIKNIINQIDFVSGGVDKHTATMLEFFAKNGRSYRKIQRGLTNIFDALYKYIKTTKQATGDLFNQDPTTLDDLMDMLNSLAEVEQEQMQEFNSIRSLSPDHYQESLRKFSETIPEPGREFQVYMTYKINPDKARDFLINLGKRLDIKFLFQESSKARGHFFYKSKLIVFRNIDNIFTLAHEMGHAIDGFIITKKDKTLNTLKHALWKRFFDKLPPNSQQLFEEAARVSSFVRPSHTIEDIKRDSYRKSSPELMADFFTLYLFYPKKAKQLAPHFFDLYNNLLKEHGLGDIFSFVQSIYNTGDVKLPFEKEKKEAFDKLIDIAEDLLSKADLVEGVKDKTKPFGNSKEFAEYVFNHFQLPFWVAQNNELFKPFYKATRNSMMHFNFIINSSVLSAKIKEFNHLPEHSKKVITEAIYLGNSKYRIKGAYDSQTGYYNEESLKQVFKMTPQEIDIYKSLTHAIRRLAFLYYQGFVMSRGGNVNEIKQEDFEDFFRKHLGYFPIMRFGHIAVYAEPQPVSKAIKHSVGEEQNVFMLFDNKKDAIKYANWLKELGYKDVVISDVKRIPKSVYKKARLSYLDLLHLASLVGMDEKEVQRITKEILGRSGERFRLPRKYVPGYMQTSENLTKSFAAFAETVARFLTKQELKQQTQPLFEELRKKHPDKVEFYDFANNYIDAFLTADRDRLFKLRKFIYAYQLAWKIGFFAQNLFQPTIMTLPELNQMLGVKDGMKVFTQAYKDTVDFLAMHHTGKPVFRKKFTRAELADLQDLEQLSLEGAISGQYTNYILNIKSPIISKTDQILSVLGIWSETINRWHAALAFTRAYRLKHKSQPSTEAVREFIERTQGAYGAYNIPQIIERSGALKPLTRMWFIFKTFHLHYLNWIAVAAKNKEYTKIASSLASLFAIAGISGIPAINLITAIISNIMGEEIDEKIIKAVQDTINNSTLERLVLGGFSGVLGINPSLFGVGDVFMPSNDPFATILGVPYMMAKKIPQSAGHLLEGEKLRALETISPAAVASVLRAIRFKNEGLRKKADLELIYQPTGKDIILQAMSFTPFNVSLAYTELNAKHAVREKHQALQNRFYRRYTKLKLQQLEAMQEGDKDRLKAINNELMDLMANVIEHNRTSPPEFRININSKTLNKRITEAIEGKKDMKGVPRQLRPRFFEIENRIKELTK
ncbi:MAG: hypothetical protein KatS3mg087_1650 [Patescibacteria group bacterium]|nr:MAG: hypothetical protein KatS3mg087_1650 [Patescibacteria group bacterium]